MERLTKLSKRGDRYVSAIGSGQGSWPKIVGRLAEYENTGMEPVDILSDGEMEQVAKSLFLLNRYRALGTVEHLQELVMAEREGRLTIREGE